MKEEDPRVGVLALQGASTPHQQMFGRLGHVVREVRRPQDLDGLSHLVIPGGESTTIHHLLKLFDLWNEIQDRFHRGELCLFGTCAGAILLGREEGVPPPRMGLLDAVFERNAYGRQVDSFQRPLAVDGLGVALRGVFIRAPKAIEVGQGARVLAHLDGCPVLVQGAGVLAATFHPELSGDPWLHAYFLGMRSYDPHDHDRAEGFGPQLVGASSVEAQDRLRDR